MKFREFLVVAMVAVGTTIIIFDTLSGASKIGAGSSPSVHRPQSAQLSALTMTNLTPVEPGVSLAGSPQGIDHTARNKATTQRTKHKNVAPEKSGADSKWVAVEISVYSAKYHNGRTATGERYDHYAGFTAATTRRANGWDLPRGSVWEVNYRGKTVVVRVNDCGSYRPRKAKLWLDLSGAAWAKIAGSPSRYVAKMRRVK